MSRNAAAIRCRRLRARLSSVLIHVRRFRSIAAAQKVFSECEHGALFHAAEKHVENILRRVCFFAFLRFFGVMFQARVNNAEHQIAIALKRGVGEKLCEVGFLVLRHGRSLFVKAGGAG
jgi:hypothetical protein